MEYEVKILEIDPIIIRKKLISIGCKRIHDSKMMKRTVFSLCNANKNGFSRVRDEGGKVTITSKIYKDQDFPQETEVSINETYESACKLIESLGLQKKSVQESIREKWSHPLAHEITIDNIPGIPTYMEIDCINEKNLNKLIGLLEVDKKNMRTGGFDKQFEEYYGIPKKEFIEIPVISFRNIANEIKPRKNKELLESVKSKYTDKFLKKADKNNKTRKSKLQKQGRTRKNKNNK